MIWKKAIQISKKISVILIILSEWLFKLCILEIYSFIKKLNIKN